LPSKSDKFDNLIDLADRIRKKSAREEGELRFMSRLLVMVNLPYRNPGDDIHNWTRTNGNVTINVVGGYEGNQYLGLPYGVYPRLIMSYIVSEAVKKKSPYIYLGGSFYEFTQKLEIPHGGNSMNLFYNQLKRLLGASFSWIEKGTKEIPHLSPFCLKYEKGEYTRITDKYKFCWPPQIINQDDMFKSYLMLNYNFFEEIIKSPIPIDLRVVKELKSSALNLDMYFFLAWRTFNLKKGVYISFENLSYQMGHQFKRLDNFSKKCKEAIETIKIIYPQMPVQILKGRIYLGK
jgi:hypothetical protein